MRILNLLKLCEEATLAYESFLVDFVLVTMHGLTHGDRCADRRRV